MGLFGCFQMAGAEERMMRINWVFAASWVPDVTIDMNGAKNIGPSWGSWKSWRACGNDNVICHDRGRAQELLNRAFQAVCNFYVPRKYYQDLGRPLGVKLYDGDYLEETNDLEDIIAMHLAAANSDIVLLAGFELIKPAVSEDQFEMHKIRNRLGLIRQVISSHPNAQWVVIDHIGEMDQAFSNLPNLTCDSVENVLKLLV